MIRGDADSDRPRAHPSPRAALRGGDGHRRQRVRRARHPPTVPQRLLAAAQVGSQSGVCRALSRVRRLARGPDDRRIAGLRLRRAGRRRAPPRSRGYTGHALRAFIEAGGETGANVHHLAAIEERRRLLSSGEALLECLSLSLPDREHRVTAEKQPSRLYGHSLADVIALSAIATLATVDGMEKLAVARRLVEERPELVDLRIEDAGPRAGMLSVAQPQLVVRVERLGS